ncbi:hypothetical protein BHE74_00017189 [Ensete ventricosum]|nr:hypothetical protein BHE74_00017189 [Ensete ventricosum]
MLHRCFCDNGDDSGVDDDHSNYGNSLGYGGWLWKGSEFARRFAEGIRKLAGNTSGDHRKKTGRLTTRMSEAIGLAGGLVFTQRRSVVDIGVLQEGGLGSGRRPLAAKPL